jgi:hypothetical protein
MSIGLRKRNFSRLLPSHQQGAVHDDDVRFWRLVIPKPVLPPLGAARDPKELSAAVGAKGRVGAGFQAPVQGSRFINTSSSMRHWSVSISMARPEGLTHNEASRMHHSSRTSFSSGPGRTIEPIPMYRNAPIG